MHHSQMAHSLAQQTIGGESFTNVVGARLVGALNVFLVKAAVGHVADVARVAHVALARGRLLHAILAAEVAPVERGWVAPRALAAKDACKREALNFIPICQASIFLILECCLLLICKRLQYRLRPYKG